MELGEAKADQVLNTYLKFCEVFQREGKITDNNFNRIRFINGCLNGKQDEVREVWGDLFDEIYSLLQKPEIKLRLEKEERKLQLIRQKKKLEKQKLLANIQSKNNSPNKHFSNNLTASPKKVEKIKKNRRRKHSASNRNSPDKKQKQTKKLQYTIINRNDQIRAKSREEMLEIYRTSVALAKQEDEARKKSRRQNVQPIREASPKYTFDDSSIFEDIMDERRAEGKGYGGSK
ncbi:hypothetical protein [Nostoc sp.]|uniref:hypothetical protein n=1 Tax=Nostoc sp. TaxID=1180 RepID=UPI002FF546B3